MTNMLMTDKVVPAAPPQLPAPPWARVITVSADRWRVTDLRGRVVGHVRARRSQHGWRFSAERFSAADRAWRPVGEFWRAAEALECLHYLA